MAAGAMAGLAPALQAQGRPAAPAGPAGKENEGEPTKQQVSLVQDVQDAFDRDDFDPIAYINEMFPTEGSLTGLDPLVGTLKHKIQRVDTEILRAVRQQGNSGSRAREDLGKARSAIEELFARVGEIRRKAEASEAMVQEICRDIKKLDYAKKHLTHTITALRRLAMLVNAVDQLQDAVERQEFAEAAQLLEAVQQLFSHFQSYSAIPKVAELGGRLAGLQRALAGAVQREFELLGTGEDTPPPAVLDRLRAACAVIDALGYKARDELIDYICNKEMGVYGQIFSNMGETAHLDRTERRYNWLRKRMKAREEVWAVFPEAWRLPQRACQLFCALTRQQLADILAAKATELPNMVEALLLAVTATNDFEAEMAARFGGSAPAEPDPEEEEGQAHDSDSPASAVRQRYERIFRERQRAAAAGGENGAAASRLAQEAAAAAANTAFKGAISTIFADHLQCYVDAEEAALRTTLDTLLKEETWRPLEDAQGANVLRSASELFAAIKRSLQRCSRFVTRGSAMLALGRAFQRVLRTYASRLVARLPKTAAGGTNGTPSASTADWQVKLADEDIAVVCTIISTAEYCTEVVGALGRNVAKTLDPPYGDQVDVSDEEGEFQGVATACLSCLLLGLETRLDAALQGMARLPWASLEAVGDQSEFVNAASRVLAEVGPRIGGALATNQWRYLCDKLAASFCPRYVDYIFRCKKVSEAGSQQLLLDTQAIKGMLLDFPAAGRPDEAASSSFTAYVMREMGRAEALLKVVGSRPDTLLDNFGALLPGAGAAELQRILDLKVLKRQEQQALLDAYAKRQGRGAGMPIPAGIAAAGASSSAPSLPRSVSVGAGATAAGPAPGSINPMSATARPAARAAGATQELASRLRMGFSSGTAAARASAAGDKMQETMAKSLAAMKNLGMSMRPQQHRPE